MTDPALIRLRDTVARIVARQTENAADLGRLTSANTREVYQMETSDHLAELIDAVSAFLETLED